MDVSIIVQSCDRYEKYWDGFFYYMDRFWDKSIDCPKYFCTEEKDIKNNNFIQIKTGKKSFVENLTFALNKIETKYVFYLLEDFWPIQTINFDVFHNILNYMKNKDIKMFQVSPYVPYYKLNESNDSINNQKIFKFDKSSDWRFNFQSRFWEKQTFLNNIKNPKIKEEALNSSISVEVESSKFLDENLDVYFYHYFWYPMSGVSYRGDFTNFGLELQNNMMIDLYGKNYH
jgi:hypothetical protein